MSITNSAARLLPGIDVSRYQQKIDWSAVAASGVQFCFMKATEGARDVDAAFTRHWEDAETAGLIRGAYHFFRPQIPVSTQAELFARTIGQLQPGDLPPALDLEGTAGWIDIPLARRAPLALNMLEALEARVPATPVVYMSPWFATELLKRVPQWPGFRFGSRSTPTRLRPQSPSPGTPVPSGSIANAEECRA